MSSKNEIMSERARRLIPGGAHTYSKGDDQFPTTAPKIISHGKGAYIWDVDGNKFLDMAMSLGTVLLGHAYEPVLEKVRSELGKGVNFCRPSYIEGEVAELLNEIIPSAEMVKFAKNGSDATTAAVKLARAYTGRDYVARCADDPFNAVHDWFIGSTVVNRGVPKAVQELTLQFKYNDIESCEKLFNKHSGEISCFLLEPISMVKPENDFLEKLKTLCEKNGALLIFDEVVSGFRFSLGGVQEMTGVTPHLTALGKGMANGFALSALVGRRDIMKIGGIEHDQERVFLLSTTHGGETHSLAAAKATINEIQEKQIIKHFWSTGERLQAGVRNAAEKFGISHLVKVVGYPCKPGFVFLNPAGKPCAITRTLFLQETMRQGLLFPYVVPCYAHKEEQIDEALKIIESSFSIMGQTLKDGSLEEKLEGPAAKPVFRKFN